FELWTLALEEGGIPKERVWILPIRNIDRYSLWPHHVEKLCPSFDTIFSGSPLVRLLWTEAFAKNPTRKVLDLQKRLPVSGTLIRQRLLAGEAITDLVPKSTSEFFDRHQIGERLRWGEKKS